MQSMSEASCLTPSCLPVDQSTQVEDPNKNDDDDGETKANGEGEQVGGVQRQHDRMAFEWNCLIGT